MDWSLLRRTMVAAPILGAFGLALAQGRPAKADFGKREYDSNCAGCHGSKGRGDGEYKPYLTRSPADLATLSKSNGGVFPFQRVYDVIDGRKSVGAHGPRDMPIWGADYLARAAGDYLDVPYDPELYVRTRMVALIDYLERLQVR